MTIPPDLEAQSYGAETCGAATDVVSVPGSLRILRCTLDVFCGSQNEPARAGERCARAEQAAMVVLTN